MEGCWDAADAPVRPPSSEVGEVERVVAFVEVLLRRRKGRLGSR